MNDINLTYSDNLTDDTNLALLAISVFQAHLIAVLKASYLFVQRYQHV